MGFVIMGVIGYVVKLSEFYHLFIHSLLASKVLSAPLLARGV